MTGLTIRGLSKVYPGGAVALDDFDLDVAPGEMVVLVGPSGCGKTTLLRIVAGLERATSGRIEMDGRRVDGLEPRERDVAMVFQNYALYPHMTVAGNLGFGLRLRGVPREEIRRRVREVADTLELGDLLNRRPAQLSGGQRQRVALGRAIVRHPRVFLFDEPLSNLDARLRGDMRAMIRRLHDRMRVTSIYVTHDQVEAMTIGDRIVVMSQGRIRQAASPEACYARPADTFVATFVGTPPMNLIEVRVEDGSLVAMDPGVDREAPGRLAFEGPDGEALHRTLRSLGAPRVRLGVRPEDLGPRRPDAGGVRVAARVTWREPLGHETRLHLRAGAVALVARVAPDFAAAPGDDLALFVETARVHVFDADSGRRIDAAPERAGEAV